MGFLGQKGMVLSGIALLLVLPALLLSATFLTTVETGGELTAVQGLSDKVAYKAFDIKKTLRYRKQHGGRLDRQALNELEKRYEQSSVIGDIEIDYSAFNLWVKYSGSDYSSEEVHATDNACIVKNLKKNNWTYNFEASIGEPDYDYNEPLLRLESLGEGNWRVSVAPTFTHSDANATVYWENRAIFEHVNAETDSYGDPYVNSGTSGAGDGYLEGATKIVSDAPEAVFINIKLEDPGGTVRYEETFSLRKPEEMEIEETKENLIYMDDAIAKDGPINNGIKGGVEFSVKNDWENTITIKNITIDPAHKDINAISDEVYGSDPEDHEISADVLIDGTVDDYVDYSGGKEIPKDGLTADINVDVTSKNKVKFYLYEFYDKIHPTKGAQGNWDMVGEDIKITLTYEVEGNQKKKTFTITPESI